MKNRISFSLLLVITIAISGTVQCKEIHVSNNDSSKVACWETSSVEVCPSLNLALADLGNGTVIYIEPGIYPLWNGTETNMKGLKNIAIVGVTKNPLDVKIECNTNAGLSFSRVTNLTLSTVALYHCGSVQESTSTDPTNSSIYLPYNVALHFHQCNIVTLRKVQIQLSNGTGVSFVNTVGDVVIKDCLVNGSSPPDNKPGYGGGGVQIELTHCMPEVAECTDGLSQYDISNTNATENQASEGYLAQLVKYKSKNHGKNNFLFGKGGGLSLNLRGMLKMKFSLKDSLIARNRAHYGGGLYIAFHDSSIENSITVKGVVVTENSNLYLSGSVRVSDGSGGGGKVLFASDDACRGNRVTFTSCQFKDNVGLTGGGTSVEIVLQDNSWDNQIIISDVNYTNNTALLGSGAYFAQQFGVINSRLTVNLSRLSFERNILACVQNLRSFASLPCSGTVYTSSVPLTFKGDSYLDDNKGTALEFHSTSMSLYPNASIHFRTNTGNKGGAIGLYDCSYILLHEQSLLEFIQNSATQRGGAIYSDVCTSNNQPATLSSQCFVRYIDSNVDPSFWNTKLYFNNNIAANQPNALYASSAIPCLWPTGNNITQSFQDTFCWNNTWVYIGNDCHNEVKSAPAFLNITEPSIAAYPGEKLKLDLEIRDGSNNLMAHTNTIVCIHSTNSTVSLRRSSPLLCDYHYLVPDDRITLFVFPPEKDVTTGHSLVDISVSTTETVSLEAGMTINLTYSCPTNFKFDSAVCNLNPSNYSGLCCYDTSKTECSQQPCTPSAYVYTMPGYCVTLNSISHHASVVMGLCPPFFNQMDKSVVASDLVAGNESLCHANRTGRLCGQCVEGFGVPINSLHLECSQCDYKLGLPLFFTVQIVPLSIMLLLLLVTGVKLTSGSGNAYVFYSQVVTFSIPAMAYPSWLSYPGYQLNFDHNSSVDLAITISTLPYSIWNMNFLTALPDQLLPICIRVGMTATEAIAFDYVLAIFPLLLLLVVLVWIELYNRGVGVVVCMTQPVHRALARFWHLFELRPSLADAIAIILVLSITKFAEVSLKLLTPVFWRPFLNTSSEEGVAFYYDGTQSYFAGEHLIYGVMAVICLVMFSILPALYLILYPFRWFQQVLNAAKLRHAWTLAITNAFVGSFKNGTSKSMDCRYVAGLYILLRIAVMCLYYLPYEYAKVITLVQLAVSIAVAGFIMIIRPYSRIIHNLVEFLLFLLLGLLSGLCTVGAPEVALVLMYIPLIGVICLTMYWLGGRVFYIVQEYRKDQARVRAGMNQRENDSEDNEDLENRHLLSGEDESLPDRVVNPNNYQHYLPPTVARAPSLSASFQPPSSPEHNEGTGNSLRLAATASYGSINT